LRAAYVISSLICELMGMVSTICFERDNLIYWTLLAEPTCATAFGYFPVSDNSSFVRVMSHLCGYFYKVCKEMFESFMFSILIQSIQYSQFLQITKQQITCAKEVHDLLLKFSKKVAGSWNCETFKNVPGNSCYC
jgi:hypothetical protein